MEHPSHFRPKGPDDYQRSIDAAGSAGEKNRRIVATLGSIFTPLTHRLKTIVEDSTKDGLYDPPVLGGDPVVFDYKFTPTMDYINVTSGFPVERFDRFEQAVRSGQSSLNRRSKAVLHIIVPIGEYGDRIAYATANATRALYAVAANTITEDCGRATKDFRTILDKETYQQSALMTTLDGLLTVAGSFSILNAKRVRGHDDPVRLYQEMLDGDLLNNFALGIPFGYTAFMISYGYRFKQNPLEDRQIAGKTKLMLSREVNEFIAQLKRSYLARKNRLQTTEEHDQGCPVAHEKVEGFDGQVYEKSGIHAVASALLPYIAHFYYEELRWAAA